MDCRDAQALIHGYVDGELDLVTSLEIERHLHGCTDCAHALSNLRTLSAAIRSSAPYFRAPPGLSGRVRASVRGAIGGDRSPRLRTGPWLAIAASLLLIAGVGWVLVQTLRSRSDDALLTGELVASHVRSQMLPSHRLDVVSTDAHMVKPWFEGKLDFSPPATDLRAQGFPLIGGRLDYLHGRPVAAIVYQRRKHTINVFIWPSTPADNAAPEKASSQGFHLIRWTGAGMTFWAVSDLNQAELQEFARLMQE